MATPQERLAALEAEADASLPTKPDSPIAALRKKLLSGGSITSERLKELISSGATRFPVASIAAAPAPVEPPSVNKTAADLNLSAEKAKRLAQLENEADNATPFKDLAAKAKDFFLTKPAEGAATIRKTLLEGGDQPSFQDFKENPFTAPQVSMMTTIGNLAKNVIPTEEDLIKSEMESKLPGGLSKPFVRAGIRTLAETATEAIPITPTEIALQGLGGPILEGGAAIGARALTNAGKRALALGLEAGSTGAEQALFKASLSAKGGGRAADAARAMKYEIPKVQKQISMLAKDIRGTVEPVTDLFKPGLAAADDLLPKAPQTVSEVQARSGIPPIGPAKKGVAVQPAAQGSPLSMRKAIADARQLSKNSINLPAEYRASKRVNLVDLEKQQAVADEIRMAARESNEKSFFGRTANKWEEANDLTSSGWNVLERAGPVGQHLRNLAQRSLANGEIRAGGAKVVMRDGISKLSDLEKQNLIQVLDEGIQPMTHNVRIAAEAIKAIDEQIAKEATGLLSLKRGESVIPWVGRKNHFPHIMDVNTVEEILKDKGSTRYAETIQKLIDGSKGRIKNAAEAARELDDQLLRHRNSNFGLLEKSRQFDSPYWIKDVDAALSTYYDGAFKRLEMAKAFGPRNEKGLALISKIKDLDKMKTVHNVINGVVGADPKALGTTLIQRGTAATVRTAGNSLMGLAQVSNSLQGIYGSAIRVGLPNALKAAAETYNPVNFASRKEARDFAIKSGALIEDIAQEATSRLSSRDFLKKSGFEMFEEMNRIVSANAAKYHAADLVALIKSGKEVAYVDREMMKLGLNKTAIAKRGFMNDYEIRRVANEVTNISQGRSRAIEQSTIANNYKLFFQLRNFAVNWSRFVKDEVGKEALKGNTRPLRNFVLTGAVLGEPIAQFREAVTGQKRMEKTPMLLGGGLLRAVDSSAGTKLDPFIAHRVDAIAWLGGLGMMRDVANAAATGKTEGLLSPASLVPIGEAAKTGLDIGRGIMGDENAPAPAAAALKFSGRRVAPIAAAALLPKTIAPFAMIGGRFVGERADEYAPLIGEGLIKAGDETSAFYDAVKRRLGGAPDLERATGSEVDANFRSLRGRKPVFPKAK